MGHVNCTTESKKVQHLKYEERLKLEALLKTKLSYDEIGEILGGRSGRTIRREVERGTVLLLNSDLTERKEYSADVAQRLHDELGSHMDSSLKTGSNFALVEHIEQKIGKENYSPYAALEDSKQKEIEVNICLETLYNNIDDGLFLHITNDDLHLKKEPKKRNYDHVRTAHTHHGTSISERPKEIENRADFGHWELDTVVGGKGTLAVLLVMTERSLNLEIIRKTGSGKFKWIFKTITCDNVCENLDQEGMERSTMRTSVYYAHPYISWGRGSNECTNKLIKRFIPKGADISKYSMKFIRYIEHWINNYPRKMFGVFLLAN